MAIPKSQTSDGTTTHNTNPGKIGFIILAVVISVIVITIALLFAPNNTNSLNVQHNQLLTYINDAAYTDALVVLEELEVLEGSTEQLCAYRYEIGSGMVSNGDYTQALSVFEPIAEYQDSSALITRCHYNIALTALNNGQYTDALATFESLGEYEDCAAMIAECNYGIATGLLQESAYQEALDIFTSIDGQKDCTSQIKLCYEGLLGEELLNATVGDIFTFGSYEQDNDISNGSEDIEWQVLARDGSRILVISKYALDCQLYNITFDSVTWDSSSIRKWLNTNFLLTAFTDWQRDMIPSVTIHNENNYRYGTLGGAPTQDQIFLLSIAEANRYFRYDNERLCLPTMYALANGAWTSDIGYCYWWLRSPGDTQADAAAVFATKGGIHEAGNDVDNPENAIRPAMWIDLDI